jgi:lipopolysaccharide/colanic/teichoic acid biosynthesis glycosyltransferase
VALRDKCSRRDGESSNLSLGAARRLAARRLHYARADHAPSSRVTSVRFAQTIKPHRADLRLRPRFQHESPEAARRALNVAVAAAAVVLAAPLMVCIAVLIKVTSRGSVFYTHLRVGMDRRRPGEPSGNNRRHLDHGGKPFKIYKFRTMRARNVDDDAGEVWASPNDPRITHIGRILRLYRLDELPQLLNVLRGEMNVVGPRPEQPTIFARLRQQIDGYEGRQRVRPGITGWAQINQSYDNCLDDVRRKLQYDLEYIARQSVFEDMRILLRTVPVVVGKYGAR